MSDDNDNSAHGSMDGDGSNHWTWGGGEQWSSPFSGFLDKFKPKEEEVEPKLGNLSVSGEGEDDDDVSQLFQKIMQEGGVDEVGEDASSVKEIIKFLGLYKDELSRLGEKYWGGIELGNLTPLHFFYYLEAMDEKKNPSWKNRKHRFYPSLKVDDLMDLSLYFRLSWLAYECKRDDLQKELSENLLDGSCYDIVHCKLVSTSPKEPAFFIAVKRDTMKKKNKCEVVLSIRGTDSTADLITDIMCEPTEYRDGHAHQGILDAGKDVLEQFIKVMDVFVKETGVQGQIQLVICGHSLGGGASCIVGMELKNNEEYHKRFNVRVIGYGTPGVVSKDLGEKADFITTVVCDSDMVPRTSAEAAVNLILDILEFDWSEKAKLDAKLVLNEVQSKNSWFVSESFRDNTVKKVEEIIDDRVKSHLREKGTKRHDPVLFPPGKCIHLYRDGVGISGSIVPGSFFDEIDLSRTMVKDHLCDGGYSSIMLQLQRQHHGDENLRREEIFERELRGRRKEEK